MPVQEKTGLQGLLTNVAETQAPAGTLIEAENVVMRRPGCIEPRDGLQRVGSVSGGFPAYGFSWRSKDFYLRNNGSNAFAWFDTSGAAYQYDELPVGGTMVDPQPFRRDIFARAEARGSLYLPYEAGTLRMESDAGPWRFTGLPAFASVVSGSLVAGSMLPNNELVAYRAVAVRTDANGLRVSSIPSGALIVSNTSGGTRDVQLGLSAAFSSQFDSIEIYRTRGFPTGNTPDEEYQLVATVPASTTSHTDTVAVDARGAHLYTSPSRGGSNEANELPPAACCLVPFRGSLIWGNVRRPRRITVSYGVVATRTGSATGLGSRVYTGTTSNGSPNLTLLSSTVGLEKGMVVYGTGIPLSPTTYVTNISGSTVTLNQNATASGAGVSLEFRDAVKLGGDWQDIFAVNLAFVLHLRARKTTPPESGYPNTLVLDGPNASTTSLTIQATHGSEYSPPLPNYDGTPLALAQDAWPGGIIWSKPDEPEHVRPIDYMLIGEQNKAILALIPTRDALFILKEDGIFRLTGANGSWRWDPFDPTARCVLPSSARAVRGRGVFLGDRGVAMVSDEGVELISSAINDQVKPVIDQIIASWLSTGFYELPGQQGCSAACVFERESEYTLMRGSTATPLVFNDVTGAWTALAYYGHANEGYTYKALFNFERSGKCVLSLNGTPSAAYFTTLLSTDAGADYLRYDRETAITVSSYAAPNATLSAPINALEDDIIKDSAGRYWRITAAVNLNSVVPVTLGGGTASMATGAATLYRSLRCSVIATGFAIPLSAQKQWGALNTAWTKLVGVVRLRYGWQSNETPAFTEQDAYTSLARPALASGNGVTNYPLGLAEPADISAASARAWLLRARIRWAMAHGDAQLEGISADLLAGLPARAKQQVSA